MPVPPQPPSYATTSSKQSSATTSTSSLRLKTNLKTKQPHAPRSLDRLFAVDTTRALNVSLPSRYDPYYRFQDKPPVYAPYNSDVLEAMAKYGLTSYSLALSEDSRCWRLYELLQDEKMMRDFMKDPKDWIVRLGPRGMFSSSRFTASAHELMNRSRSRISCRGYHCCSSWYST
jgi:hypothetical protein